MRCKNAHVADRLHYLVMTICLDKKLMEPLLRNILQSRSYVNTRSCLLDSFIIQIRCEYLDGCADSFFSKVLQHDNSKGNRFFACSATRYPDAYRIVDLAV